MQDEDDHIPHLYPHDPVFRVTWFDAALALVTAGLAVLYYLVR